ncbi:MAG: ComEC/Rec2 family competence protein [Patescibacteria group bacterium]|nr:ComEC/Rec2 family competence protein [Patescibacteria group bacterium]
MFSKSKIFLISCLVFIVGIAAASFLPVKFLEYKIRWFGAAIFFLMVAALLWQTGGATAKARPGRDLALLGMAILCFALWRYAVSLPQDAPDKIWHYHGKSVVARGLVASEPDPRETSQKLEIAVVAIQSPAWRPAKGRLLVTTNLYPEHDYGDELEIACQPEQPEEFNGFAYDRYLARYNIYAVCYYPKISVIRSGQGNLIYRRIFHFKKILAGLIDAGLSEPEASLARPIVFGGQKGLPQNIRDDFQKVGLTHIMAVSGFNVSILAAIAMAVLLALGVARRYAFYLAVALLAGYIILVGAPASATRAGLMAFFVLWALKLGRLNKMTNSLVLTAAILLLINPKLLRDDAGFQLSFAAMAGLVYVYPILEALWEKIKLPKLKGVSDALLITLAAQTFTVPILAYDFSRVSLIAPLANLAVLWAVPILTMAILAALPLAALVPKLSFLFFLPSLILTKYILAVVKFFAGFKFSSLTVGHLAWGWVAVYYLLIIFLVIKLRRCKMLAEKFDISSQL